MKIAYIGLGKMGSGIARNLLRAGMDVNVYNRSREKSEVLASEGARVAGTPAEACDGAEVAMTMLSNDEAVAEVVFGGKGIAAGLAKGAVHISNSTISRGMAQRLNEEHAKSGQGYLSAPVFGRPDSAEAKKLLVAVAGRAELIGRFRPVLDSIGRHTIVVGVEPWQANVVKLCGNFMIASMMEAFGETFAVMRQSNIDHHLFLDSMVELFGSPLYKNYGTTIANDKYEPAGFDLKLGLKDIRLVLDAAQDCGTPMPLASLLRDHFVSAMAHGQEHSDWSSIARVSARAAGL